MPTFSALFAPHSRDAKLLKPDIHAGAIFVLILCSPNASSEADLMRGYKIVPCKAEIPFRVYGSASLTRQNL